VSVSHLDRSDHVFYAWIEFTVGGGWASVLINFPISVHSLLFPLFVREGSMATSVFHFGSPTLSLWGIPLSLAGFYDVSIGFLSQFLGSLSGFDAYP